MRTSPASQNVHFRKDVQGLRGWAVLLVVIYHTGSALPGGFIGVDVFFVISGYLIVGLIDREVLSTGRLDLNTFFSRRIRRLLPALALTTSLTIIAAALVVEIGDPLRNVARTALGASLFAGNAVLYLQQDYFAPSAERNPLLHTWSLSVEEQFYLAVPVLLAVLAGMTVREHRLSNRSSQWGSRAQAALAALSIVSFAVSVWMVDLGGQIPGIEQTSAFAFYSPATRAWEFGFGGLLALARPRTRLGKRATRVLVGAGGAVILGSAVLLDAADPFPGIRALPVVVGTLAILQWSGGSSGIRPRFLEHRVVTALGDLSYSWYLWHWPAIVLARAVWGSRPVISWSAAASALFLAWVTYHTVERPIRRRESIAGRRALTVLAGLVALPVAIASGVQTLNATATENVSEGNRSSWSRDDCHFEQEQFDPWPGQPCVRGANLASDENVDVLLLGDSHANALADGVLEAAEAEGRSLAVWTAGSQPAIGESVWVDRFAQLTDELRPEVVIVASRTLGHLSESEYDHWGAGEWVDRDNALDEWVRLSASSVENYLRGAGTVIWVHNVPEVSSASLGREVGPTLIRPKATTVTFSLNELERQRDGAIQREAEALGRLSDVILIDPAEVLCAEVCSSTRDGARIYADGHHLNRSGSLVLAPRLRAGLAAAFDGSNVAAQATG